MSTDHKRFASKTSGSRGQARRSTVLALAILGVVLAIVSVVVGGPGLLGLLALVPLAVSILALVLVFRGRRPENSSASAAAPWLAAVGVAGSVLLLVMMAITVATRPSVVQVEVRWEGPSGMSVAFSDDLKSYDAEWPEGGFERYTTERDSAQITVTAPASEPEVTVSCGISWGGEIVVEESHAGTVTCRYDRH